MFILNYYFVLQCKLKSAAPAYPSEALMTQYLWKSLPYQYSHVGNPHSTRSSVFSKQGNVVWSFELQWAVNKTGFSFIHQVLFTVVGDNVLILTFISSFSCYRERQRKREGERENENIKHMVDTEETFVE